MNMYILRLLNSLQFSQSEENGPSLTHTNLAADCYVHIEHSKAMDAS